MNNQPSIRLIGLYRMGDHWNHWSSDSPSVMRINGNMIKKRMASTDNAASRCLGLYSRFACSSSLSFKRHILTEKVYCGPMVRLSGSGTRREASSMWADLRSKHDGQTPEGVLRKDHRRARCILSLFFYTMLSENFISWYSPIPSINIFGFSCEFIAAWHKSNFNGRNFNFLRAI